MLQKQQISIQKTFQFISSINGVSQTYKKAKIFFLFDPVSQHIGWNKRRPTRRHYKAIYFVGLQSQRNTVSHCAKCVSLTEEEFFPTNCLHGTNCSG